MVDAGDRDTALSGVKHAHSEAAPRPLLAQKDHLRAAAMTQPLAVCSSMSSASDGEQVAGDIVTVALLPCPLLLCYC